jgi:dipeptidyl aminopeptidase/acylaminoacyl peptidase
MNKRDNSLRILAMTFVAILILSTGLLAQEKRAMNFVDVINLKRVSNPVLSPDGNQILFTITNADWKENKFISHIWRLNTDGTNLVQMTNAKDGESGGQWSPDGKYIAFVTKRDKESQIYFLNTSGGEAIQFTEHKSGVNSFQWSPDSKKIYFTAPEPLSKEEEKRKKEKDDAFIFEHNYKNHHLWVIDVATKEEKRLTEGDFSVRGFNLSRDGSKIVYLASPTPLYDDVLKQEIWFMDLADGSKRQVTSNSIPERSIELSPDNGTILFVAETDNKFQDIYYQGTICTVPAEGGTPTFLIPDFNYEVYGASWSADGKSIYFIANMGVHSEIFSVSLKDKKVNQLTDGKHAIFGFDYVPKIDTIAYLVNSPHNPGTFWMSKMAAFSPEMIYDPYPELKDFKLAKYEAIQWKGTDGVTVEGILIYPIDYEKGKRYPLLAHTHGGPMASDQLYFDGYAHARAGRGYAILKPNYRGSTGYGNDFLRDMVGHYFLHAHEDVITGVDYLIKKGIANPDKLGTLGWSAGGHMTNWLVTYTDRFKAASSGAGASNWISMYAQSDVRIYRTPWFLGDPWHKDSPLEAYRKNSAIFYVYHAKTPTLIMYGQNDQRVPLPQGYEMYRGLKANGVPTELVIFPREGHGPRELRHYLYKMNKEFQWLEKYIMAREFKFDQPEEAKKEKEEEEKE